eukprot:TRINITY_DN7678_c0_g1_i11.p1 TRINITY_DN7678_c0_g1~~TRINITY_DN7678_c0_g1_i11.p1  ORF type:complete len:1692 (+),score=367.72 TRINITY_DN7678_c0_g1_i11:77-5152(+)
MPLAFNAKRPESPQRPTSPQRSPRQAAANAPPPSPRRERPQSPRPGLHAPTASSASRVAVTKRAANQAGGIAGSGPPLSSRSSTGRSGRAATAKAAATRALSSDPAPSRALERQRSPLSSSQSLVPPKVGTRAPISPRSSAGRNWASGQSQAGGSQSSAARAPSPAPPALDPSLPSLDNLGGGGDSIKVCVRIRPLNAKERSKGEGDTRMIQLTSAVPEAMWLTKPPDKLQAYRQDPKKSQEKPTEFRFHWVLPSDTTQPQVHQLLGHHVIRGITDGYHGCVFAYGQTGSGKSHSIFGGTGDARGLLPRVTEHLFQTLKEQEVQCMVKLSYLELYNERARDMLRPVDESAEKGDAFSSSGAAATVAQHSLEIRQHPRVGVFVEGLSSNVVESVEDVMELLDYGNKIRVVGCTNMNAVSSRSHAIVTLEVQRKLVDDAGVAAKKQRAQLHTVDLAGSERLHQAGASADRQKESKGINKSLLALGQMIAKLAARSSHVPYRDSKLTFLLSDSLMGNCRTAMLACISPAASEYSMTESTLRFASSVKTIHTKPVKNEEAEGNLVKALYAEIEKLKESLRLAEVSKKTEINEQIATAIYVKDKMDEDWERDQEQTKRMTTARRKTLHKLGLTVAKRKETAVAATANGKEQAKDNDDSPMEPYLVNECDDPLLSRCLKYRLPMDSVITVGSDTSCNIVLDGLGVQAQMCNIRCINPTTAQVALGTDQAVAEKIVPEKTAAEAADEKRRKTLFKGGKVDVFVNDKRVAMNPVEMTHGDRLRVGATHVFQFVVPTVDHKQEVSELLVVEAGKRRMSVKYSAHLEECVGSDNVAAVSKELLDLQPLIEEANSITDEVRGSTTHECVFRAHVLTDMVGSEDDHEVVVAMRLIERPDDISSKGTPVFKHGKSTVLQVIWTAQKFRQRLDVMRDLYNQISDRDSPWGQAEDPNPWADADVVPNVRTRVPTDETPTDVPPSSPSSPTSSPRAGSPQKRTSTFSFGTDAVSKSVSADGNVQRAPTPSSSQQPAVVVPTLALKTTAKLTNGTTGTYQSLPNSLSKDAGEIEGPVAAAACPMPARRSLSLPRQGSVTSSPDDRKEEASTTNGCLKQAEAAAATDESASLESLERSNLAAAARAASSEMALRNSSKEEPPADEQGQSSPSFGKPRRTSSPLKPRSATPPSGIPGRRPVAQLSQGTQSSSPPETSQPGVATAAVESSPEADHTRGNGCLTATDVIPEKGGPASLETSLRGGSLSQEAPEPVPAEQASESWRNLGETIASSSTSGQEVAPLVKDEQVPRARMVEAAAPSVTKPPSVALPAPPSEQPSIDPAATEDQPGPLRGKPEAVKQANVGVRLSQPVVQNGSQLQLQSSRDSLGASEVSISSSGTGVRTLRPVRQLGSGPSNLPRSGVRPLRPVVQLSSNPPQRLSLGRGVAANGIPATIKPEHQLPISRSDDGHAEAEKEEATPDPMAVGDTEDAQPTRKFSIGQQLPEASGLAAAARTAAGATHSARQAETLAAEASEPAASKAPRQAPEPAPTAGLGGGQAGAAEPEAPDGGGPAATAGSPATATTTEFIGVGGIGVAALSQLPPEKAFAGEVPADAEPLQPCPQCGRKFRAKALEKHINICAKVFMSKREKFDAAKHFRAEGAEKAQAKAETKMKPETRKGKAVGFREQRELSPDVDRPKARPGRKSLTQSI